ncbi:MAG: hypothetical protein LBV55_03795 [Acholeplasmatales bacterium]|nr:hypothetical protein [Acholeplasmatales bacterium]
MSLKKKIIYTAFVLVPILMWVIFFTSVDIVKNTTSAYFWYDLTEYSSINLTNSYIYLIFKILIILVVILFGLYTFFKKKEVKWYYYAISLVILSLLSLIPFYIVKDLVSDQFVAPWIYGFLGIALAIGLLVALEFLTIYQKVVFGKVASFFKFIGTSTKKIFKKGSSAKTSSKDEPANEEAASQKGDK